MRVAFNLLRKYVLSLLSSFSSIKLILSLDDWSRQECILVFGFALGSVEKQFATVTVVGKYFDRVITVGEQFATVTTVGRNSLLL